MCASDAFRFGLSCAAVLSLTLMIMLTCTLWTDVSLREASLQVQHLCTRPLHDSQVRYTLWYKQCDHGQFGWIADRQNIGRSEPFYSQSCVRCGMCNDDREVLLCLQGALLLVRRFALGCIFTNTMFSASVSCVQLLPDSSPVLLGCNYLRTDSTKAFKINSMISHSTRKLQHGRARSFARLVSGPQHPEACSTLSRADMEEPLNISDDGQTFTCAITGAFTRYIVVPSSLFSTSPSSLVLNCMEMKVLRTSLP